MPIVGMLYERLRRWRGFFYRSVYSVFDVVDIFNVFNVFKVFYVFNLTLAWPWLAYCYVYDLEILIVCSVM